MCIHFVFSIVLQHISELLNITYFSWTKKKKHLGISYFDFRIKWKLITNGWQFQTKPFKPILNGEWLIFSWVHSQNILIRLVSALFSNNCYRFTYSMTKYPIINSYLSPQSHVSRFHFRPKIHIPNQLFSIMKTEWLYATYFIIIHNGIQHAHWKKATHLFRTCG